MKNVRYETRRKLYAMLVNKQDKPERYYAAYYTRACLHCVYIMPFVESRNGNVLVYETININTNQVTARTWYECNMTDIIELGLM